MSSSDGTHSGNQECTLKSQTQRSMRLVDRLIECMEASVSDGEENAPAGSFQCDPAELLMLQRRTRALSEAASSRGAVALVGPTQTGKGMFVHRMLQPKDPSVGALGRRGTLEPPSYLPTLSFEADLNPRGAGELTGLVTRFTSSVPGKDESSSRHPVLVRCLSRGEWLMTLARGVASECDMGDRVLTEEGLEQLVGEYSSQPPDPADSEWRADLVDAYSILARHDRMRYRADVRSLAALLGSHTHNQRGYLELAAGLFWPGLDEIARVFQQGLAFIDELNSAGLDGFWCHWAAVPFIVDSQGMLEQPSTPNFPARRWSDFVFRSQEDGYLLDYQPGAGPPMFELSTVQSSAREVVFPVSPERLSGQWGTLLESMDVLDIPGLRGMPAGVAQLSEVTSDAEVRNIIKRGKIFHFLESYLDRCSIDAMVVLLRSGNVETRGIIKQTIDRWGRLWFGDEWPSGFGDKTPALFLGLTGIDDEIAYRDVDARTYNARLGVLRDTFWEMLTDFGAQGRPFTNVFPVRFPGVWDTDAAQRESLGTGRWMQAERLFLQSELVARHVADAHDRWHAAMTDADGGVELIASSVCKALSSAGRDEVLSGLLLRTHRRLRELAEEWLVDGSDCSDAVSSEIRDLLEPDSLTIDRA